jgi:hypothetical protein
MLSLILMSIRRCFQLDTNYVIVYTHMYFIVLSISCTFCVGFGLSIVPYSSDLLVALIGSMEL